MEAVTVQLLMRCNKKYSLFNPVLSMPSCTTKPSAPPTTRTRTTAWPVCSSHPTPVGKCYGKLWFIWNRRRRWGTPSPRSIWRWRTCTGTACPRAEGAPTSRGSGSNIPGCRKGCGRKPCTYEARARRGRRDSTKPMRKKLGLGCRGDGLHGKTRGRAGPRGWR